MFGKEFVQEQAREHRRLMDAAEAEGSIDYSAPDEFADDFRKDFVWLLASGRLAGDPRELAEAWEMREGEPEAADSPPHTVRTRDDIRRDLEVMGKQLEEDEITIGEYDERKGDLLEEALDAPDVKKRWGVPVATLADPTDEAYARAAEREAPELVSDDCIPSDDVS